MGVIKFFSSSSNSKPNPNYNCDCNTDRDGRNLPNPKPDNYEILKHIKIKDYLIVKIKYINYENKETV